MAAFGSQADIREWLDARPVETARSEATALATRAALRVVPLIVRAKNRSRGIEFGELTLAVFRSTALARTAVVCPFRAATLGIAAPATAAAAYGAYAAYSAHVAKANPRKTDAAAYVAYSAHAAADTAAYLGSATRDASFAAAAAANAGEAADPADAATIWRATSADATLLEAGRSATLLMNYPLWLSRGRDELHLEARTPLDSEWRRLREILYKRSEEGWSVWIEWYDAVLLGHPPWPQLTAKAREDLSLAVALLPDDTWGRAATIANAEIKRLIGEAHRTTLPDEEAFPRQVATAAQFGVAADGAIGKTPPGPEDRLTDSPEVRDFYRECRDKADDLAGFGRQILGERLDRRLGAFIARTPDDFVSALERDVWSSGNSLRGLLNAHNAIKKKRDVFNHPSNLDPGAAEALGDLVETFNNLALADPKLLVRDSRRPGPREHDYSRQELDQARAIVAPVLSNREVTNADVAEELAEEQDATRDVRDDLAGKQQVAQGRDTHRNFFGLVLVAVYRNLRKLPEAARGEGSFASREIASGAYKTIGAGLATIAGAGALHTVDVAPQVIDFVFNNLDSLREYCTLAFENAPGASQILRWLELHVEPKPPSNP